MNDSISILIYNRKREEQKLMRFNEQQKKKNTKLTIQSETKPNESKRNDESMANRQSPNNCYFIVHCPLTLIAFESVDQTN